MGNVEPLKPWEVVTFVWGSGIRHRNGEWSTLVLNGTGQEINVTGMRVILHENGIEFGTKGKE